LTLAEALPGRLYNNQEMRPAAGKQMTKCTSANVARLQCPANSKTLREQLRFESMIVQANIKDASTVAAVGFAQVEEENIGKM
jgi:hypothetical protein